VLSFEPTLSLLLWLLVVSAQVDGDIDDTSCLVSHALPPDIVFHLQRTSTQQRNYHDSDVKMLQTIMNVCRLQSLEAVASGFSDFVEEISIGAGMADDKNVYNDKDNGLPLQMRDKDVVGVASAEAHVEGLLED
jgi:hypothetical protein